MLGVSLKTLDFSRVFAAFWAALQILQEKRIYPLHALL
nr:MAG TPA: hypothetical protein [Caudoviricetes sp.]